MPEDTGPEEKIDALLAEREAIRLRPDAEARQADIDKQLDELGYKPPGPEAEAATEPVPAAPAEPAPEPPADAAPEAPAP